VPCIGIAAGEGSSRDGAKHTLRDQEKELAVVLQLYLCVVTSRNEINFRSEGKEYCYYYTHTGSGTP
jgi:hypothetical protein